MLKRHPILKNIKMRGIFIGAGIVILLLLVLGVGVVAQDTLSDQVQKEDLLVAEDVEDIPSQNVKDYVEDFVEKRGIAVEDVSGIYEVDFEDLPKEVNIEGVGDHNLAIYEVEYDDAGEEEKIFVVSYSVGKLKSQGDIIISQDKRQFLNFGFSGTMEESSFLKTATGVEASLNKGYVMMRPGSITGISTNLEVVEAGIGQLEIIVYKNGNAIGFGNTLITEGQGVQKDYDVQSKGSVTFEPGDVISVYLNEKGESIWEDVITMIEITTTN